MKLKEKSVQKKVARQEAKANKKAKGLVQLGGPLENKLESPNKFKKIARAVPRSKYSHKELAGKSTHHALSFGIPISIYILVAVFHLPWIALSVILLSKWQIFVVKPRFWWANIKYSGVDLIFKLNVLLLMLLSQLKIETLVNTSDIALRIIQMILIALYLYWNLYLRKLNNPKGMLAQALTAQLVGLIGVAWLGGYAISALPVSLTIALSWVIAYATAQHTLYAYEESAVPQLASFWALFASGIMLLQFIWAQNFSFLGGILYLPLMPLVVTGFGYLSSMLHSHIEDIQSDEEISKVKLARQKEVLQREGILAVATSIVLAVFIMIR